MNEDVNESLCKICHYQQNVRQQYYLLDTIVSRGKHVKFVRFVLLAASEEAKTGLKVNDQLVAYATRFSAVRLKNHVWSHPRALKAKVQCDFSSAYSPDHFNVLRLINIINIRYNITRHKIRKSHHFSFIGVCCI